MNFELAAVSLRRLYHSLPPGKTDHSEHSTADFSLLATSLVLLCCPRFRSEKGALKHIG